MPRATIDTSTQKVDLKTAPPDGFVMLRRMTYGKWLHRQELALKLQIDAGKKGDNMKGEMQMANKAVTLFEFQECVIDHNLENDAGEKLDFKQPYTLDILDPRIGNEIGEAIMRLHEADLGNSEAGSNSSSTDQKTED